MVASSTRSAAAEFSHGVGMGGVGETSGGPAAVAALPQNAPAGAIDGASDAGLNSGALDFPGERSSAGFRQINSATEATGSTVHAGRIDPRNCLPPSSGHCNMENVAGVGGCGSDQAWSGGGGVDGGHGSNQAWSGGGVGGGHGSHVVGGGGSAGGGVGVDGSDQAEGDGVGVSQGSNQLRSGGGVGDHGSDQARRDGGVSGYGSDQLGRGDGAGVYRFDNEGSVGVGVGVGGVGDVGVGYATNPVGTGGGGAYDCATASGSNIAISEDACSPLRSRGVASAKRYKSSTVTGRGKHPGRVRQPY
ncbi:unnamed protein product [Laminaria digitata]